jgi:hypothetical protein
VVTILVSAKANETRLNNLILLIAISYTISFFQVQKVKNKGVQEYILRTNEKGRKERIHSSFFVGLSIIYWATNDDFIWELVENLMIQNRHKLLYYQRGLKAMNKVVN